METRHRALAIIVAACTAVMLMTTALPAHAQPAPADHGSGTSAECQRYGCLYAHDRCHWTRTGQSCTTEHGIAHERLPDGPDGRRYVGVLWPMITDAHRYDPARRASWDRLAGCESTWQWHYNGSSGYDGGIQFHPQTWRAYGGQQFAAYAWQATPEQQIAVGERVLWAGWGPHGPQGRGAWPGCLRQGRGAPHPM